MEEIKLEDIVECKYTGLRGTAVSKTEFVNGCIQFGIAQKTKDKEKQISEVFDIGVDSQSLKLVKKGPRHQKQVKEKSTGGPMRKVTGMRGY